MAKDELFHAAVVTERRRTKEYESGERVTRKRVAMTTVVITRNGKVFDLGKGEFPGKGKKNLVANAYTCTQEQADKLKEKT